MQLDKEFYFALSCTKIGLIEFLIFFSFLKLYPWVSQLSSRSSPGAGSCLRFKNDVFSALSMLYSAWSKMEPQGAPQSAQMNSSLTYFNSIFTILHIYISSITCFSKHSVSLLAIQSLIRAGKYGCRKTCVRVGNVHCPSWHQALWPVLVGTPHSLTEHNLCSMASWFRVYLRREDSTVKINLKNADCRLLLRFNLEELRKDLAKIGTLKK